jgi:tetratricopeptide (TPR) repeat protein
MWPMKKPVFLGALALLALVLAIYLPVTGYGFVNFDDARYVTDNPFVLSGLTRASVTWAFLIHGPSMWVPLTLLSHQAVVSLAGVQSAGAHHAVNVGLHAAAALMLYAFLLQAPLLADRRDGDCRAVSGLAVAVAWVATALWAAHPLHVEPVAWVTGRKEVLAGACWMLTLLAYLGYVRRPGAARYLLVLGALALALMAKPSTVTLPLVLLLLDVWPFRRLGPFRPAEDARCWPAATPLRAAVEKLPLLALAAGSLWMTVRCQESMGIVVSLEQSPLAARVGNAVISYAAYLGKLLWPADLAVFYPYPARIPLAPLLVSLLVLLTLTLVALRRARQAPAAALGWLWYLLVLVPMSGLAQNGLQVAMADRYAYLPAAGLLSGAAAVLGGWSRASRRRRIGLAVAGAAAILLLALIARRQLAVWQDSESLFRHALAVTPEYYAADDAWGRSAGPNASALGFLHFHLGMGLVERQRLEEGIAELRLAQALNPADPLPHYHLGGAYVRQERRDLAAAEYRAALALDPANVPSLAELAQLELDAGRNEQALPLLIQAARLAPTHAWTRDRLGVALILNGRETEGIAELQAAAALAPWDAEIRGHLELALTRR